MPYVLIERQHDTDLAIEYPSTAAAQAALTDSPYIEAWCKQDALDAYVVESLDGLERTPKVISPVKTFAVTVYVQADSEEYAEAEVKRTFDLLESEWADALDATVMDVQPVAFDEADL